MTEMKIYDYNKIMASTKKRSCMGKNKCTKKRNMRGGVDPDNIRIRRAYINASIAAAKAAKAAKPGRFKVK